MKQIVIVVSGLYQGESGFLRRRYVVNDTEYAEVELLRSVLIARVAQLNIGQDTERAVVDAIIREEKP